MIIARKINLVKINATERKCKFWILKRDLTNRQERHGQSISVSGGAKTRIVYVKLISVTGRNGQCV